MCRFINTFRRKQGDENDFTLTQINAAMTALMEMNFQTFGVKKEEYEK